jgi:hypothetical protein
MYGTFSMEHMTVGAMRALVDIIHGNRVSYTGSIEVELHNLENTLHAQIQRLTPAAPPEDNSDLL